MISLGLCLIDNDFIRLPWGATLDDLNAVHLCKVVPLNSFHLIDSDSATRVKVANHRRY